MQSRNIRIISILWVANLLGSVLAFLTQTLIARKLDVSNYGIFSSALGTVTLLTPLVGFGIAQFWLKAFGEEGGEAHRWLKISLRFVVFSGFGVFLAIVLWAYFGPHDKESRKILIILSGYLFGQAIVELIVAKYQLEESYKKLIIWQFFPHFIRFLIVLYIFLFFSNVTTLDYSLVYGSVSMMAFLIGWMLILKSEKRGFSIKGHDKTLKLLADSNIKISDLFKEIWPFGMAGVFYLIYFQSSLIMLKYIDGNISAGFFAVVFLILQAVYIFPAVVFQKFLMPKIHRWAQEENEKIRILYEKGNKLMFLTGIGTMVLVWVLSPFLIPVFFGEDYTGAILPLVIISISIPLRFLSTCSGSILATKDNMRRRVSHMKWAALINIIINLMSIPLLGIYGAVLSAIVCDLFILIAYRSSVRKFVFKL